MKRALITGISDGDHAQNRRDDHNRFAFGDATAGACIPTAQPDGSRRGAVKRVVTVTEEGLSALSAQLLAHVRQSDFHPDALIGIATGGLRVVDAMPAEGLLTMSCTLRRPGTERKQTARCVKQLIRRLPVPVCDAIRIAEDFYLERRPIGEEPPLSDQLLEEAERIGSEVRAADVQRIALVDDAVDSGTTMARVAGVLTRHLPPTVDMRTAVLTTTRVPARSAHVPDYTLFERTLLRFPWSMDFHLR